MIRKLFKFLSALSLLLCVATTVMWGRSYWWADEIARRSTTPRFVKIGNTAYVPDSSLVSERGYIWFDFFDVGENRNIQWEMSYERRRAEHDPGHYANLNLGTGFLGLGYYHDTMGYWHMIVVPHWFVTLSFAIPPFVFVLRWFRRPRIGHCPSCGYDLRATEGECPECGATCGA